MTIKRWMETSILKFVLITILGFFLVACDRLLESFSGGGDDNSVNTPLDASDASTDPPPDDPPADPALPDPLPGVGNTNDSMTNDNSPMVEMPMPLPPVVVSLDLVNVANVSDNGDLNLNTPWSVAQGTFSGKTYFFASGYGDSGVSSFSLTGGSSLVSEANVKDDLTSNFRGTWGIATAEVGGNGFLVAAGFSDNGLSTFQIEDDGSLVNRDNATYFSLLGGRAELIGATGVTTVEVGGSVYVYVSGFLDDGITGYRLGDDGSLSHIINVTDGGNFHLKQAKGITTGKVGDKAYLFVTGYADDGVNVLGIRDNGWLDNIHNVKDDAELELDGASAVATAEVAGKTFLFVAGYFDDGVSVFEVASGGRLTNVHNLSDEGGLELNGAEGLAVAEVDGTTFLFVTGRDDSGFSAFIVENSGQLVNVANVSYSLNSLGSGLELLGASGITAAQVDGKTYVLVSGVLDNGISLFAAEPVYATTDN